MMAMNSFTALWTFLLLGSAVVVVVVQAEFVDVAASAPADNNHNNNNPNPLPLSAVQVTSSSHHDSSSMKSATTTTITNTISDNLCGMPCPQGTTCQEITSPWDDALYLCMMCPPTNPDDGTDQPEECVPYYNPYDILHAQSSSSSSSSFMMNTHQQSITHGRRRAIETTLCALGGDGDDVQTLTCLNGGQCADDHDTWIGNLNSPADALCDCSTAGQMINGNLTLYTGKSCEIPIAASHYCTRDIDLYCVNGGDCRGEAADFQVRPCKCPEGYTGRHCEYHEDFVQECTLDCNNHGTCQHGLNTGVDQGPNAPLGIPGTGTMDFMHCQCDDGYAGTTCEYDYIECKGRGRYCYHGSTCGTPDANGISVCECLQTGDFAAAGDLCEYKKTDTCTNPKTPTDPDALTSDMAINAANFPFCVNNGECVQKDNDPDEFYCECAPNEYDGIRCEHVVEGTLHPAAAPVTPVPTAEDTTWEPTVVASETDEPTIDSSETYLPTDQDTVRVTFLPTGGMTISNSEADTSEFMDPGAFAENLNQDPDGGKLETEAIVVVVCVVLASFSVLALAVFRYRRNQKELDTGSGLSAVKEDEIVFPPPEEPRNFELTSSTTNSQSEVSEITANGGLEPVDLNQSELV